MAEFWPFPPRQPVSHELEWQTDVLGAQAAEQRIALRPVPREIVTYIHLLDAAGLAQAAELARAGFRADWLLPTWHWAARATADVAPGDAVIRLDTGLADWSAPGWAAIAIDGGLAQAVEIAAVLPDRLELTAPVGRAYAHALVAPARAAILTAPVGIDRRRQGLGLVTATFTLTDGGGPAASAYPRYLGLDVLTEPPVLRQPLAETLGQTVEYIDNGFGPIVIEPVLTWLQRRATITLVDRGPAARLARRRWLQGLRGRQGAFWLPTWGRELRLQAPMAAGATAMIVASLVDLGDPVGLAGLVGRHLMIEAGTDLLFRAVTAAAFDPLGLRLTISAPGIALATATPVHWLTKVRLDTDRVEWSHTATRSEMSVATIEVPA